MTVDTKSAERRQVKYASLDEISKDLDRMEAAHHAGTLQTTGNWSAGQIFEHVSILFECSLDGFPSQAPAPLRWMAILFFKKKALSGETMPAGFKLPKGAAFLIPQEDTTFEEGLLRLRQVLARVEAGERFRVPSPMLGKLSHEEWTTLHCSHCSLHMSFIDY